MSSRFHMRSLIKSKHEQLSKNIKEKNFIEWKTTNISSIHLRNQTILIKYNPQIIESKNRLHRQCEAYDDYQSKCFIFIHLYHTFSVEKWKNKKLIESKTTNISYIHLQNQMIPIKYYLSLIKSKNRLHRQCEAYDDYQSKCFIFIHS